MFTHSRLLCIDMYSNYHAPEMLQKLIPKMDAEHFYGGFASGQRNKNIFSLIRQCCCDKSTYL